jgi:hypothetical protein
MWKNLKINSSVSIFGKPDEKFIASSKMNKTVVELDDTVLAKIRPRMI